METKPLLFGLIGFFLGGLIVSIAATTFDKPANTNDTTMSEMTAQLRDLRGDEFDKAYLAHMISHHESAVDMAELANDRAKHDEIKALSSEIISAQQDEIHTMKDWQAAWDYGVDERTHDSH